MSGQGISKWVEENISNLEIKTLTSVAELSTLLKAYKSSFSFNDWTPGIRLGHLKLIKYNGEIIGLLNCSTQLYKNKRQSQLVTDIFCMEIFPKYRGQKLGTLVLYKLMNTPVKDRKVTALAGESHWSAIPFWWSVGADMEKTLRQLRDAYQARFSQAFILRRRTFNNIIQGTTIKEKW